MPVYSDKCQDSTACICQSFKYFKIKASLEKKKKRNGLREMEQKTAFTLKVPRRTSCCNMF